MADITINGTVHDTGSVPAMMLLVDWLRDGLQLTGTHVGCDTSQCGACTVLVDGHTAKACTLLLGQLDGASITTIEGLGMADTLHPMQAAFRTHHGLQCGFCTPGMVIAGIGMAHSHGAALDEATVRHELEGNLCRCTGYQNIVAAILAGAKEMTDAAR
jgi:aerobic carbon-monoxide dehydrogenase small subunit